jgi:ATP-dependent Lhr-like helicase
VNLPKVSPFAVPALLEIGKERVAGAAHEMILEEAADELIAEAMA